MRQVALNMVWVSRIRIVRYCKIVLAIAQTIVFGDCRALGAMLLLAIDSGISVKVGNLVHLAWRSRTLFGPVDERRLDP